MSDSIEAAARTLNADDEAYVVLVHGWGGSPEAWRGVEWPERWRPLAYELPGHGDRRGDRPFTIRHAADGLAEFIRTHVESDRPVIVVAHSMGGQLSLLLNAEHPELLDGEVVIDPAYGAPDTPEEVAQHRKDLNDLRERPYGTMLRFLHGAFSPYLSEAAKESILVDVGRTEPRSLADYYWDEYLSDAQVGLYPATKRVAARRTRPVLGIYRTPDRAEMEESLNPGILPCRTEAWGADHGHYLQLEAPDRLVGSIMAWAGECIPAPVAA
ncbi:hydrolase [Bifidobacterium sp. DSM 109958]|uniref:Hydrolase n=1 Tax=Bifidobacterium moraviense TaxID=2675323 RepID=A0A7Y0I033_9BIFI|nr:alpha/beta hydrolase [Bifidobacterium sp. DSM 109958]NMN00880.1 hydrolase [Bifidobacterium sp. DSM 109958]